MMLQVLMYGYGDAISLSEPLMARAVDGVLGQELLDVLLGFV